MLMTQCVPVCLSLYLLCAVVIFELSLILVTFVVYITNFVVVDLAIVLT